MVLALEPAGPGSLGSGQGGSHGGPRMILTYPSNPCIKHVEAGLWVHVYVGCNCPWSSKSGLEYRKGDLGCWVKGTFC